MAETDTAPAAVRFDLSAAADYARAAAAVAEMLATAADHTDIAADADLSGLGVLGQDFAASWSAAVASQSATVRIASSLVGAYAAVVTEHGRQLGAIDTATADTLTTLTQEI